MLYFPQLSTGSVAQYPISRSNIRRTVINSSQDGMRIAMADSGAAAVRWNLSYSHLTTAELAALQLLFEASCGRWQTFTFVDPTDNLINWSEDLSQAEWNPDPLLTLSSGIQDPRGSAAAWQIVNTAQANQAILQTQGISSLYQYCLSLYVRSDVTSSFTMVANSTHKPAIASPSWTRIVFPFRFSTETGTVSVGVSLPPGSRLYVFGLQLESQPGAGGYKKTRDRAGVYPNSRFDQDVLTITATGVNQFSTTVTVTSMVAG